MSTRQKIVLALLMLFITLVLALAIVVPRLVDLDRYRPELIARIEEATGKRAEIGRLTLTLFPTLSIRADDFALANPPRFPPGYLLTARRIYIEVDGAALWHRQIVIRALELDGPAFNLLSDSQGHRNFENVHRPPRFEKAAVESLSPWALGVISKVKIKDGRLTDATLLASGQLGPTIFEARGISSQLQVDFRIFSSPQPGGTASKAGLPLRSRQSAWNTAFAYADTPEPMLVSHGTFNSETFRFGAVEATGVKSGIKLLSKQLLFHNLSFDFYGGHATGDFNLNFAGQNSHYSLDLRLRDVDMAKLLAEFPRARGKVTGKMEGNLMLEGDVTHSPDPVAGQYGTGRITIRKGQLPNLQLNKNLLQLARLANLGPASGDPSSFSLISADLNIANERITSRQIQIVGNGVDVDASGSLIVVGEGTLAYEGVAKVRAEQTPVTNILSVLSGAQFAGGKLSFPFNLLGTLEHPRFVLKSVPGGRQPGGVLKVPSGSAEQSPAAPSGKPQLPDLIKNITGLLKRKQPQPPSKP